MIPGMPDVIGLQGLFAIVRIVSKLCEDQTPLGLDSPMTLDAIPLVGGALA